MMFEACCQQEAWNTFAVAAASEATLKESQLPPEWNGLGNAHGPLAIEPEHEHVFKVSNWLYLK